MAPLLSSITRLVFCKPSSGSARRFCRQWPWRLLPASSGATSRSGAAAKSCRHDHGLASCWKLAIGAVLVTIVLGAMWWAFREGKHGGHTDTENTAATQRSITDVTLAALALLTTLTAGCATAVSSACPREVEYLPNSNDRLPMSYRATARWDGAWCDDADYGRLRDQA